MSKDKTMVGALYFDGDDIIGHLSIGETHFQITGVRVSAIRSDIKAKAIGAKQTDLFEEEPPPEPVGALEAAADKWRALGPTKQSGMRCKQPAFWAYLKEGLYHYDVGNEDEAAAAVREICAISSRADFAKPGFTEARDRWRDLDENFQAWMIRERL